MTAPAPSTSETRERSPAGGSAPAVATRSRLALRAWHWLLTPGWIAQSPAARLRGWARLLDWRDADRQGKLRLLRRAIWTPVRAWKEAGEEVRRTGADVEAASGVPPAAQRRQLWYLAVRHGVNAHSYRAYQLYRPERRHRADRYVQEAEFYRVVRWYNRRRLDGDYMTMLDKPRFGEWCDAHGFPRVPTVALVEDGAVLGAAGLPPTDLFQKPVIGTGGRGTEVWRYGGDGVCSARDGSRRSAPEILAHIAELSRSLPLKYGRLSRRILIQPCLRNHRELLPLTPGALATLRVVTYREPGGSARVLLAAHKFPRAGAAGDNTDLGGISAAMDLATGRLAAGVGPRGVVRETYTHHPDTGVEIVGCVVPHWQAALALATRALDATTDLPSLGWDIAITDDGPVLLEGNPSSNPGIAQAPTGIPLSDTPFPAAIESHLHRALGL